MMMTFILPRIMRVYNSKFIKNYQNLSNLQLKRKPVQLILDHQQHQALLLSQVFLQVYTNIYSLL